jgi:hypothetical protein
MFFKEPENTKEIYWTRHIKEKMRYYGLSEGLLRRILKSSQRQEYGVAPKTIALMKPAGTKKPSEIWLMYQPSSADKQKTKKKIMISAWRYPGISPKGKPVPIPEDILEELKTEHILTFDKNSL